MLSSSCARFCFISCFASSSRRCCNTLQEPQHSTAQHSIDRAAGQPALHVHMVQAQHTSPPAVLWLPAYTHTPTNTPSQPSEPTPRRCRHIQRHMHPLERLTWLCSYVCLQPPHRRPSSPCCCGTWQAAPHPAAAPQQQCGHAGQQHAGPVEHAGVEGGRAGREGGKNEGGSKWEGGGGECKVKEA
jgi:hypothetical protein